MKKCARCKKPRSNLNPIIVNGLVSPPICGLCALAVTNEIHGTRFTSFQGEMAQLALEQAEDEEYEQGQ